MDKLRLFEVGRKCASWTRDERKSETASGANTGRNHREFVELLHKTLTSDEGAITEDRRQLLGRMLDQLYCRSGDQREVMTEDYIRDSY